MGNKQTAFDRKDAPVQGDPVAEAHAAAIAEAEAQAKATDPVSALDALVVDQGVQDAPAEQPIVEKVADVVDTTVPAQPEPEQRIQARIEPRRQDHKTVQRPSGARSREASPTGGVHQDVQKTSTSFESLIAKEKQTGTAASIGLIVLLEGYVTEMAPGRITRPAVILKNQEGLYDQIVYLLERAPVQEFKRLWSILIAFAREYADGAFSAVYYSRGAKEWRRSPQQYHNLTLILNLVQASAADMASVNQQVSVNSVVANGFTEDARGRLLGYYMN